MAVQLPPDVEKIVAEFLRSQSDVAALVSGRVYTDMQGLSSPTYPLVLVGLLGGPSHYPAWLQEGRLQVEAWWRGGKKPDLRNVILTVAASLPHLENTVHTEGVVGAVDVGTPHWLPDTVPTPAMARWLLDVTLTAHPNPNP